jgi:hypothetical protein
MLYKTLPLLLAARAIDNVYHYYHHTIADGTATWQQLLLLIT